MFCSLSVTVLYGLVSVLVMFVMLWSCSFGCFGMIIVLSLRFWFIISFFFLFFTYKKKKDIMKREAENMKTSSFYEGIGLDSWSLI